MLMPETTGQQAWAMAERLLASVRSIDIPLGGERLGVSASVGVAEWRGHDDLEALIREADRGCTRRSARGRLGVGQSAGRGPGLRGLYRSRAGGGRQPRRCWCRQAAGVMPKLRLKARLKAASDS